MACPYFTPTERCGAELWPFRARLPLGDGWLGFCSAPGHEGEAPGEAEIANACNLGYARRCPRLPQDRPCDAVRFGVARDHENHIAVGYVCERDYLPQEHGTLEYDSALAKWLATHSDARIQRQAECFLQSYLRRRESTGPAPAMMQDGSSPAVTQPSADSR